MKESWSKERIISELKKYHAEEKGIPHKLRGIVDYYFGSIYTAYDVAGIPYKKRTPRKKLFSELTDEEIKSRIVELTSQGAKRIFYIDPVLYYGCLSRFGSWYDAVKWAGIDNPSLKREAFTKEELLNRLRQLDKEGQRLTAEGFQKLARWAYKHFGTWEAALTAAGLDYNSYTMRRKEWTKESILELLREYVATGKQLTAKEAAKWDSCLPKYCAKFYGGFANALSQIGLKPYKKPKKTIQMEIKFPVPPANKKWTREVVIQEILALNGVEPLNNKYIKHSHGGLERAARQLFGSWRNAIETAGLNIADTNRYSDFDSYLGNEWELLCKKVLDAVDNYDYQVVYGNCIPDFSKGEHGEWIDAKLSSWAIFTRHDQVKKYLKKCSKLIFLYLRGGEQKHRFTRVEMRHISYYYEPLRAVGREDLIAEIESFAKSTEGTKTA